MTEQEKTAYRLSRADGRSRTLTGLVHLALGTSLRALCGTGLPTWGTGVGPNDVATCRRCLRQAARNAPTSAS